MNWLKRLFSSPPKIEKQQSVDGIEVTNIEITGISAQEHGKQLIASFGEKARALREIGRLDESLEILTMQGQVCYEEKQWNELQLSLFNQSVIHRQKGQLDEAVECLKEQEQLCRRIGHEEGLAHSLTIQASIFSQLNYQGAKIHSIANEALKLAAKQGLNHLIEQLWILARTEPGVQEFFVRSGKVGSQFADRTHLEAMVRNANHLKQGGDIDNELDVHGNLEDLCQQADNPYILKQSLAHEATIYKTRGDLEQALKYYQRLEQVSRETGDAVTLHEALIEQGVIYQNHTRQEYRQALKVYQEDELICRQSENNDGLARTLYNQALIWGMYFNNLGEALPLAKEAIKIADTNGLTGISEHIRPFLEDLLFSARAKEGVAVQSLDSDQNVLHTAPSSVGSSNDRNTESRILKAVIENHRNIRVFISSTFQDMQEERDRLGKWIFPELRQICMERGLGFTEVDLRWGITREQAEQGEVLPICLAEIENCRPYFIGLLGNRYGWIPDTLPEELLEKQPWLAEYPESSITELEILYGVLNNPEMTDHSFFYFRDSSIASDGTPDREHQKQMALKERIRRSGCLVRENYPDAETLGKMVLEDLKKSINNDFPERKMSPLSRERLAQEVFAAEQSRIYIGRQEYIDRIDGHVKDTGPPLIVLGEPGAGKSSLLANWSKNYRKQHPDILFVMHFSGSSVRSTEYPALIQRIMLEIKEFFDLADALPTTPEGLRDQFANWLSKIAVCGNMVLVIDGIDQLVGHGNVMDFGWLPAHIPTSVRLIISTPPGQAQDELDKRGWATMTVMPLVPDERLQLINEYFYEFGSKRLSPPLAEQIAAQPQCANPLFLRVLLNELRIFGEFEHLPARIDHYLEANNPETLYGFVLSQLEVDYEKEHHGLVGETLSLIWASRKGLSEAELIEIMSLSGLAWSPLFLAIKHFLLNQAGQLSFFHESFRRTVYSTYIRTDEVKFALHNRLATYFENRELDQRKINELPWQLFEAKKWGRLKMCLKDLDLFREAYNHDQYTILTYWQSIENNSKGSCTEAYQKITDSPEGYVDYLLPLTSLFSSRGNIKEALSLSKVLVAHYRTTDETSSLITALGNLASLWYVSGNLDEALNVAEEIEWISEKKRLWTGLQKAYEAKAVIYQDRGNYDEALALLKKRIQFCQEVNDDFGLASALNNQAVNHMDRGNDDEALKLLKQLEPVARRLDNKSLLSTCLNNQTIILQNRGETIAAMDILKKLEKILLSIGDKRTLAAVIGNQGKIHSNNGNLDEALKLYRKQEEFCRSLNDTKGLIRSLVKQAVLMKKFGKLKAAIELHQETEKLCRQMGNKRDLSISLNNHAVIYIEERNFDEALRLLEEQETICIEIDDLNGLSNALYKQANIYEDRGDFIKAIGLYCKSGDICRKTGNVERLAVALITTSSLLGHINQPDKAIPFVEEAVQLAVSNGLDELAKQSLSLRDHLRTRTCSRDE